MPRSPKPPERPASPRVRRRKRSQAGAAVDVPQIETIEIDQSRLSSEIPDRIKIEFANAIITFAAMEYAAERLIWDITDLSYDDGRLLTSRLETQRKFDLLKTLIEDHGHVLHYSRRTVKEMWQVLKTLIPVRNLAVHGVWAMLDGQMPVAMSPRLPTTSGQVTGELLRLERLDAMTRQAHRIKTLLSSLSDRIRASKTLG